MHPHWHHVMGKRTWHTLTDETLERGAAAWQWFRRYGLTLEASPDVSLQDWYINKFGILHEVFRTKSEDVKEDAKRTWLCMGKQLVQLEPDDEVYFFLDPKGSAEWKFLCKPSSWMVIPTEVVEFQGKFVFHPTGSEWQLPCFYLHSAQFFGILDALVVLINFSLQPLSIVFHLMKLWIISHQFISPRLLKKVEKRDWVVLLSLERSRYHFEIAIEWTFGQCCSTLWFEKNNYKNCHMKRKTCINHMLKIWTMICTWQWMDNHYIDDHRLSIFCTSTL